VPSCGIRPPSQLLPRPPDAAFYRSGSNKTTWIVVIVVSWFFRLGFFLGGFDLLFTRPKVRRQLQRIAS
jgi:hypothetical protein